MIVIHFLEGPVADMERWLVNPSDMRPATAQILRELDCRAPPREGSEIGGVRAKLDELNWELARLSWTGKAQMFLGPSVLPVTDSLTTFVIVPV